MQASSAADWPALAAALVPAALADASQVIARRKVVKSPAEIALLRTSEGLAEQAISAVQQAIRPGVTRDGLAAVWADKVAANCGDTALTSHWEYISVGPDPWGGNATARLGDIVRVDVGCVMAGNTSDTGRTFALVDPGPQARAAHAALMRGFHAGRAELAPGVPLAQMHRAAQSAIRAAGHWQATAAGISAKVWAAGLGRRTWAARNGPLFQPEPMCWPNPAWCWPLNARSMPPALAGSSSRIWC